MFQDILAMGSGGGSSEPLTDMQFKYIGNNSNSQINLGVEPKKFIAFLYFSQYSASQQVYIYDESYSKTKIKRMDNINTTPLDEDIGTGHAVLEVNAQGFKVGYTGSTMTWVVYN